MNKKNIGILAILIVIAVVVVASYFVLIKPQKLVFEEGQEVKVQGTIITNYFQGLPVDAPAWIEVQTSEGTVQVIYNPGMAECTNTEPGKIGLTLRPGDKAEVFGKFHYGAIETCGSTEYYIKRI